MLTATAVAGKKIMVSMAMDFMAELSLRVSSAMVFIAELSLIVASGIYLELLASSMFTLASFMFMKLKS